MRWSLRVGTIAGIGVYLHWTFLLFLGWIGVSGILRADAVANVLYQILFIALLFLIVLLHELGHCLTARRFGINTRDITLLPIGGLARLERMPDDPWQEFLVAIAGPAVNVVLAIFFYALMLATGQLFQLAGGNLAESVLQRLAEGELLQNLVTVNVMLVLFNLLPTFPMDGGRVLRALLASRMEYARATRVAAAVGQAMAVLFAFVGLFVNPFLIFIALFVWLGAESEAAYAELRSSLSGFRVSNAMITDYQTLSENDPLSVAVQHVLAGFQQDFPVLRDGRVVGVLTAANLLRALGQRGQDALVRDVMETKFVTASPAERLEAAFQRLQECQCPAIPVVSDGDLVGILTMENVGEFIVIQNALRHTQR